jgi:hypothetical protein
MPRSWIAALSGALLTGALLTGCGGAVPGSVPESEPATTGTGPQTTVLPDETTVTTSPPTETSGTESTGATETAQSANTPRLPIGGDTEFTVVKSQQCAHASFLGQDQNSIPPAVSIVVTGAVFSSGLFEPGGSACDALAPGEPACLDGFVFTADDTGPCVVPVHTDVTRPPGGTDEPPDRLRLQGRLHCSTEQEAACRDLAARLDSDDQSIELFPPVGPTTGTTTDSTGTPTDSTGTTTESTGTPTGSSGTTTETETSSSATTSSGAGN